jgi:peptidyl-prolyl cis-trans isomerase C
LIHGFVFGAGLVQGGRVCLHCREEFRMAKARARHILVTTEEECNKLKADIEGGADFAKMAKQHSQCPSGSDGGDLGEFGPGQMVPEFDKVVFSADVGKVQGPVKTDFGYHLVEVTSRED